MILVVGATGKVGGEICYLLASKGLPFRAMLRQSSDPGKIDRLKEYGSIVLPGDLRQAVSLQAACQGANGDSLVQVVEVAVCLEHSQDPSGNRRWGAGKMEAVSRARLDGESLLLRCQGSDEGLRGREPNEQSELGRRDDSIA